MTMQVGGVNQGLYNYYDPYNTNNINYDQNSIYGTSPYQPMNGFGLDPYNMPTFQPAQPKEEPKKEEKKVGFFGKLWNGIKGVVKGVGNAVKNIGKAVVDIVTFKDPLKSLASIAMVAACFIPGVNAVAIPALAAYGIAKSAPGVINGVVGVATAQTAEEAEAAGMSIGENGVTLGLSIAGLRTGVGMLKTANAAGKTLAGVDKFSQVIKNPSLYKSYASGFTGMEGTAASWGQIGSHMKTQTWANMKTFGNTVKDKAKENNPFKPEGRQHVKNSAKTKYNNVKENLSPKQIKQQIADAKVARAEYKALEAKYDTIMEAKNAGQALTGEEFRIVQQFEAAKTFNSLQSRLHVAPQELNYNNFGVLTPIAANLSTPQEVYGPMPEGTPLSYDTEAYNPYLYQ